MRYDIYIYIYICVCVCVCVCVSLGTKRLMMEALRSTEKLLVLYPSIRRHISENWKFQMLQCVKYPPTPCQRNNVYLNRIENTYICCVTTAMLASRQPHC